ncbi:Pentatricopeptide repeat-containing protein [Platanthera zijinensis]|uniref:Pentatricopeptide repeat-containing protein n=1 Tax=Platanthera zijinensis TaxID=2320716 RepID=A0AAP0BS59_9ASPA
MSFYRHLFLCSASGKSTISVEPWSAALYCHARCFGFSSLEEAAAERRRRKRQLRIEPPTRRDSGAIRPARDPNAARLPDSTASLVGPRLSLHNRIQTLIRAGNLDAASAQARHALFSPIRPTVFTCNAVMSSILRARRFDDVFALFHFFFSQQNIIPNIVSHNILISAHCDAGQVDKALLVYRQILLTAPFPASIFTYRYLTKGLVDSGRIADAVSLLREMINRGHSTDALVYDTIIAGFIHLNNMEMAIEFFNELREQCPVYDGVVHATLMEGYWKLGMDKEAMDCYQSLLDLRFRMHPATCNVLLETLLKHGKAADAQNLFDQMLDEHKPPVFMGINADTYNIMINHCFKEGKFAEAIEVFHSTGVKPLPKDIARYKFIIEKLCANGLVEDAVKLFDELLSQSLEPDAATYSFFADAYFSDDDDRIEDAVVFFYKMVSGGEAALKAAGAFCHQILNGLVNSGCMSQAMDVFGKMKEAGMTPNAANYEVLIAGLCKEGNLDGARALFEEMMKCGFLAGLELQSFISESFQRAGRGQEISFLSASSTPSQATSAHWVAGEVVPQTTSGQQVAGRVFGPSPDLQAVA